jgi:hypothetical protein
MEIINGIRLTGERLNMMKIGVNPELWPKATVNMSLLISLNTDHSTRIFGFI